MFFVLLLSMSYTSLVLLEKFQLYQPSFHFEISLNFVSHSSAIYFRDVMLLS